MKKIISLFIIIALALSTSVCYYAAEDSDAWKKNTGTINLDDLTVTGSGIEVDGNTILITKGGDFTVTGSLDDGMIKVNSEDKVKLRLSGMSLTNSSGSAIYFENTEKGFITITENTENYLSDSSEYSIEDADAALFSNDDLEIKGSGTLTVEGNYKHGIASDDDLTIENGTIKITSVEHGVKANDKVSITGGDLDITAKTGKGIKAGEELVIDAGTVNIVSEESEGIESKGTLTINGGDINIKSADDGINTGMESSTNEQSFGGRNFGEGNMNENGEMPQMGEDGQMPQMDGRMGGRMMQGEGGEMMPPMQDGTGKMGRPDMQNGNMMPPMQGEDGNMPQMRGGKNFDGNMSENGEMPQGGRMMPPTDENGEMQMRGGRNFSEGEMPQGGQMGGFGGFGRIDEETAAAHAITINGGNIYVNAKGDGIDSNGSLTINGGKVIVDGPEMSGNGPLDSEGTMAINGGEVITLSSAGMLQLPNNSDGQNILRVLFTNQGKAGDKVTVKDSNGNEVLSHTAVMGYAALVYSSPELKEGNDYSIYVNDELYETVTVTSGTTSVGTASGQMGGFGGRGMMNQNGQGKREKNISVSVDGNNVSFNTNPVIKNDTTLVGFRAILEMLGAQVTWDEENQVVTATKDGVNIILTINSDKAYVNGEEKTLLTAPEIINNSTMIPVRFVSENLGMDVLWNGDTRHIDITSRS